MSTALKKILIVDDHFIFREGLMSLLRSAPDFEVVGGAGSVFEGIEMARKFQPEVILMDFSLPDGTGLDATRAILTEMPNCKIVFLTVYTADEQLMAAIQMGAKGYMLKNVDGSDLLASLRALDRDELAISRKMMSRVIDTLLQAPLPQEDEQAVLSRLSPREIDVLNQLASGASNSEIARRLFLSENTVKHHMMNLFEKLGIHSRREAAMVAHRLGLNNPSNHQQMSNESPRSF